MRHGCFGPHRTPSQTEFRNSGALPRSVCANTSDMHPLMLSLIASAGLGAMIGIIRQWNEQANKSTHADFAGMRIFTLWCLLGGGAAFISAKYPPAVLPVIFVMVGAHSILGR